MNKKRIRQLFDEGSGIVGMVAEIRMKSQMLSDQSGDILDEETCNRLARMSQELDTYRDRLNEICEEIEGYGTFSEMARE